jgi:iron complex outermembrane receptor protein
MLVPKRIIYYLHYLVFSVALLSLVAAAAQSGGTVRGSVTLFGDNSPIHGVPVRIVELNRSVLTDDDGAFEFTDVPPGNYSVQARMDGFRDVVNSVSVSAGSTATSDIQLRLLGVREEITVTASGREEVAYQSFKVVTTLDSVELAQSDHTNIGEVLENQPGIAKRSFGPGSSRPVIRGFDGDRVLILEDGARTGSLSSQSGDHAEPIDPLGLERLEVVKGPATLLYGSSALGGVVNAISGHDYAHPGLRGSLTGVAGSSNEQGGGNANFEVGSENWLVWGGGGGQRTGNYHTPIGEILNSESRIASADAGAGWFGERRYISLGYAFEDARYGIPVGSEETLHQDEGIPVEEHEHGEVDLTVRRHSVPLRFGVRNLGTWLDGVRGSLSYTNYHHEELEGSEIGTTFDNRQVSYRGGFDQRRSGTLSGSFGFDGWWRDYKSIGEEAITPPVVSHAFALFGLEEFDLGAARLQFGARYEHTHYEPDILASRSFNGLSGSAGVQIDLWEGGNVLLSYTHSGRAPALEELYNNGPHPGNLTFEIGNPELELERGDGADVSLRHSTERLRGEANFYYYALRDFVFLAPTGEVEDGLNVAEYSQADSRFIGGELMLDVSVHPNLWLNFGMDAVSARLKQDDTPLPRIPPLRGRIGFEALYKGLRVKPELALADAQDETFPAETRTAGYAVFNLHASYTLPQQHLVHILSAEAFNLGDRLYRNHLSFIKDIAPEIGRGVRVSYSLRFF